MFVWPSILCGLSKYVFAVFFRERGSAYFCDAASVRPGEPLLLATTLMVQMVEIKETKCDDGIDMYPQTAVYLSVDVWYMSVV